MLRDLDEKERSLLLDALRTYRERRISIFALTRIIEPILPKIKDEYGEIYNSKVIEQIKLDLMKMISREGMQSRFESVTLLKKLTEQERQEVNEVTHKLFSQASVIFKDPELKKLLAERKQLLEDKSEVINSFGDLTRSVQQLRLGGIWAQENAKMLIEGNNLAEKIKVADELREIDSNIKERERLNRKKVEKFVDFIEKIHAFFKIAVNNVSANGRRAMAAVYSCIDYLKEKLGLDRQQVQRVDNVLNQSQQLGLTDFPERSSEPASPRLSERQRSIGGPAVSSLRRSNSDSKLLETKRTQNSNPEGPAVGRLRRSISLNELSSDKSNKRGR